MLNFVLFGQRLRMLRKQAGERQAALAEHLGVTVSQISDMEKGRRGTNLDRLTMICEYYNVSSDYLLGLSDDPKPHFSQTDDSEDSRSSLHKSVG